MADTTLPGLLKTGDHASRPAASAVGSGALYSCTTHSLVYQSDGSSWTTWATLGATASGSITSSGYTQNTAKLLGRTTASSGAIEEISVGSGLSLSAGSLSATGGGASFSSYQTLITGMSGLVHRWKFEEASGDFADSVGSLTLAKTGTVTYGVTGGPVSGASGSITLGASAKGVSSGLGSIPVGGGARTFILVYKGLSSSSKQALYSYGTSGSTRQWFTAYLNDGTNSSASITPWGDDLLMPNSPSDIAVWHMHATLYDGSGSTGLFMDGWLAGRALSGALNTGSSGNFTVFQDSAGSNQLGAVTIDDLAVFSRALNSYELQQLYNALVGALP